MAYENTFNLFKSDELKAVVCYEPESLQDAYIRMLAEKFSQPAPDNYALGFSVLYGGATTSSGGITEKSENKKRENGLKLMVPEWIASLEHAINQVTREKTVEAYDNGKKHGKNILQRLAQGDMTVTNFEQS